MVMDFDDILPKSSGDLLAQLARQDLDPLSVEELNARIAVLKAEIARSESKIQFAINHRASAESLFKR